MTTIKYGLNNFYQLRDFAQMMINQGKGAVQIAIQVGDKKKLQDLNGRLIEINGKECYLID